MTARAWTLLVILSGLWGATFLFNRIAVLEIPPLTLVLLRVAIAAVILLAVLGASGVRIVSTRRDAVDLAVMGLVNNVVPFGLIVWGQQHIAAGLAAILNATTPIFAVLFTHALTSEKATRLKLAGVLLGVAGVTVLVGADRAVLADSTTVVAELACLGAAISYGIASVWSRRFRSRPPLTTAAGQLTASTLMLAPVALAVDMPWTLPIPSGSAVLSVVALAALCTALAYVLFFRIVVLAGATSAMLVTLLIPPSAILLGAAVLGERLEPHHFAGLAVIGFGLLLIDGRAARLLNAKRAGPP